MRIIIVDDNEDNRIILKKTLQRAGHVVQEARNGEEALKLIWASAPGMIISDILMPVMDGFQLCRRVKGDDTLNSILFVFYTATYTDSKDEEFALSLGAEWFIRKPMEPEAFVGMLSEVIEQHKTGQLVVKRETVAEEGVYLKLYNEALIRKLEDKMEQLEEANKVLEQEITEHKRAEEALKNSEERFRTSVETLIEGFAILSAIRDSHGQLIDFKYEYINEAGCQMNQKPQEEHMGKTLLELLPTHKGIGFFEEYVRVVETGKPLTKEFLIYEGIYGGGEWLRQAFDVRISKLEEGIVTTWQDITDKKKGEELLRQSEERLRSLIENSKDLVILADLEGTFTYYNGPPEYGITSEEVLGKNPFSIFEPVIAARLMNQLKRVMKEGEVLTFENNITLGGESLWFLMQMYPIRDGKGRVIAVGLIARNITERNRPENRN